MHTGPHRGKHVYTQQSKGGRADFDIALGGSHGHNHLLIHVYLLTKVWDRLGVAGTYAQGYTEVHTFVLSYAKGSGKTWGVRWTHILVLKHVHIIPKVWNQPRGGWDTHGTT